MPQSATIKSLPAAFGMMKAMQADGVEWGEDYRQGARQAVAELLRGRMDRSIDEHLERMAELGRGDRRNGCYRRRLLTELGEIELAIPRTRTFSALKVPDQPWVKADLHRIMNARTLPAAWSAARRFAERWQDLYPKAVTCLRNDLDDLLTCFRYADSAARRAVRTTNAIERRFREVRRRTRPMGTFQDRTSMERILFAVFTHENRNQGLATPFALTHNS
jgi:transposase-like protein